MQYLGIFVVNVLIVLLVVILRYRRQRRLERASAARWSVHLWVHLQGYMALLVGLCAIEVLSAFAWIMIMGHRVV